MKKKNLISIIVLMLGVIMLAVGVTFLIIKLMGGAAMQDGEYLVKAGKWVMQEDAKNCEGEEDANCEPSGVVIWDFTEIGKGTLTTNNHTNDYSFIWAIEDGKLKIETDWLYPLENEYDYSINQGAGEMVLTADDETYHFRAVADEKQP